MSHIVQIKTQVRDLVAVRQACARLKIAAPETGTFKVYQRQETGVGIKLSGWLYPVVVNAVSGELRYDNFGGRWGEQVQLDRFLQAYAVEKARLEAVRRGHSVTEQALADGSVKLTIQMQGSAA